MSLSFKELWHDPVWSKVIAGAILAAAAAAGAYSLNLWPAIGAGIKHSYHFMGARTALPNWAILGLGLTSLPALVLLVAFAWQFTQSKAGNGSSWRDYTTDTYFTLRWRWKYFDNAQPYELHTFCPHCDFQVYPQSASQYHTVDRIGFFCDSCNRQLGLFDESFKSLENKTIRFIQQKIRNSTWKDQVRT